MSRAQSHINILLSCKVLASYNDQADLKMEAWPKTLPMHLMPKEALKIMGEQFLKDRKTVLFKITPCIAQNELIKALEGEFVGCVKFPISFSGDIKLLVIMYAPHKQIVVGIIPNNQTLFTSRLNDLIKRKIKQTVK